MKQIKFVRETRIHPQSKDVEVPQQYQNYHLVQDPNTGTLKCSCGNELNKIDEDTYRCAGGYPTYRFSLGDMIEVLDKFGGKQLLLRPKKHGKDTKSVS